MVRHRYTGPFYGKICVVSDFRFLKMGIRGLMRLVESRLIKNDENNGHMVILKPGSLLCVDGNGTSS